ncbi:781_t:CDS:10, partial [Entrophospora sp. SA101]
MSNKSKKPIRSNPKLYVDVEKRWYAIKLSNLEDSHQSSTNNNNNSTDKHTEAKKLLTEENERYETNFRQKLSSDDRNFYTTMLKSGTLNDKLSTLSILVDESPLHSVKYFETLLAMAEKKSRNEAVQSIFTIMSLMIESVLPDRKLKRSLAHDVLDHVRQQMVKIIFTLYRDKPEQEQNLLRLLVFKLGDSDRKVASKASFMINQLYESHPKKKLDVIKEIEQLILSPGANHHTQYYGIISLNQTILKNHEKDVANKLIEIYFVMFRKLRKNINYKVVDDENGNIDQDLIDSKMVSAILTGINRAFKFAKVDDNMYKENIDILFKFTHIGNFNISIQALMLIYQVSLTKEEFSDRFYRTLYDSLLDPRLIHSSKQALYLNLFFKALKNDNLISRIQAFLKRLVQICNHQQPHFICGAFYMIANDRIYDGRKRDPKYCNADQTCIWELCSFLDHFHPTVSLYAKNIITNIKINSQPEIHLHTLTHFLDRFVYRNPKKNDSVKGGGSVLLQPSVKAISEQGMVVMKKGAGIGKDELNVNSEEFWRKKLDDVPADQVYTMILADENVGSDEEEEIEKEIWKAMKQEKDKEIINKANIRGKIKNVIYFFHDKKYVIVINKVTRLYAIRLINYEDDGGDGVEILAVKRFPDLIGFYLTKEEVENKVEKNERTQNLLTDIFIIKREIYELKEMILGEIKTHSNLERE